MGSGSDINDPQTTELEAPGLQSDQIQGAGRAYLIVLRGGPLGHTFPVHGKQSIGRSGQASIRLRQAGISRVHAALRQVDDTKYTIADLHSRNGTWVNDTRIKSEVHLNDGDRVRIGEVSMKFALYDPIEERLHQGQKMEAIGRLAAGIAHDFNNLLAVIMGGVSFLKHAASQGKTLDSKHATSVLADVEGASERAAELVGRLLTFSRQGGDTQEPLKISSLLAEVIRLTEHTFSRAIDIQQNIEDELWVVGDSGQLHQMLLNLLINARDAMPDGGKLEVSARRMELAADNERGLPQGAYTEVRVSDSGAGMDEVTQERAFEPFYTTKELGKGTGLGLSTVFGIVKRHLGEVTVQSKVGEGAHFRVYLPLMQAQDPSETKPETITSDHQGLVLCIDDEDAVRRTLILLLAQLGYDIVEARDGIEAIEVYKQRRDDIDLVMLDLMMPRMGGEQTFRELRSLDPDLKVIIVSGFDDRLADKLVEQGAAAFLQKPCRLRQLAEMTKRVLAS